MAKTREAIKRVLVVVVCIKAWKLMLFHCNGTNKGLKARQMTAAAVFNRVTREIHTLQIVWCKAYFDILNRSGVTRECDRETGGQTFS